MITKIKSINNMGVFDDFIWDLSVKYSNGRIIKFSKMNIIYGRNYSGKTTLSRIIRGLETGVISDKYQDHQFEIELDDNSLISQDALLSNNQVVRVFNDDFIRDNLRFIFNPEEDIVPFAILGGDNNLLQQQITLLTDEIGNTEDGKESGLYLLLKNIKAKVNREQEKYSQKRNDIDEKLKVKALDRSVGIKYKPERYGDQNYNTSKLISDIDYVNTGSYVKLSDDKVSELEALLKETVRNPALYIKTPNLKHIDFSIKAKELIEKRISESGKIEELLNDAILNRWVNEGRGLHKSKRETCAFCGNKIEDNRWIELERHFDKESEILENEIIQLINNLDEEKKSILLSFNVDRSCFYSKYLGLIDQLIIKSKDAISKYVDEIDKIIAQLKQRKDSILKPLCYKDTLDYSKSLVEIFSDYDKIRNESELYSKQLSQDQSNAKKELRLLEVSNYIHTIGYNDEKVKLQELKDIVDQTEIEFNTVSTQIAEKEKELLENKRSLNDEEAGAQKVNEYLRNFFGHQFLSLEAVESENADDEEKKIKFQIVRDGKRAYNLSEGECSLISFCYFIAKLNDIETIWKKQIIWIDDPISSLDSNHIFFLYSIIKSEIVDKGIFEQLFLSTHNLEFLKYLKRLKGFYIDTDGKQKTFEKGYFIINRDGKKSSIVNMPKYLKEYVTEFNFLFNQIWQCSEITEITDKNYSLFYNFGNNARKFLEIYLFYRFPDATEDSDKLKIFFGNETIPTILTERVNNEFSHLAGSFERGAIPIDVPEMKSAAQLIINRLKEIDIRQFDSLLRSVTT